MDAGLYADDRERAKYRWPVVPNVVYVEVACFSSGSCLCLLFREDHDGPANRGTVSEMFAEV